MTELSAQNKPGHIAAPIQVSPVIHRYSMEKPPYLVALESAFKKWLHIEDDLYLENILATRLAMEYPGDPYWETVVGASGIGKTEVMMSLTELPNIYTISKLTPQTLMSGFATTDKNGNRIDDGEYDLYPRLRDKLVIVKDFSSIGSMKWESQKAIYADLREAFDGLLEKDWGSTKGKKGYEGTFGLLVGTTPQADESMRSFSEALGERFCRFRLHCDHVEKAVAKARDCRDREEEMRKYLKASVVDCLSKVLRSPAPYAEISSEAAEQIDALATLCAILCTGIKRDKHQNPLMRPEPEVGTRLVKQFLKLGHAVAYLYGHKEFGERELQHIQRIAKDSTGGMRLQALKCLQDGQQHLTDEVGEKTQMPSGTIRRGLDDLWMLGLVDRQDLLLEAKARLADRATPRRTDAQRYVLGELQIVFRDAEDEDERERLRILERIFRSTSLTTAVRKELNILRRQKVRGDDLVRALTRVVKDHELFRLLDRDREVKDEQVGAQVVCSEALA